MNYLEIKSQRIKILGLIFNIMILSSCGNISTGLKMQNIDNNTYDQEGKSENLIQIKTQSTNLLNTSYTADNHNTTLEDPEIKNKKKLNSDNIAEPSISSNINSTDNGSLNTKDIDKENSTKEEEKEGFIENEKVVSGYKYYLNFSNASKYIPNVSFIRKNYKPILVGFLSFTSLQIAKYLFTSQGQIIDQPVITNVKLNENCNNDKNLYKSLYETDKQLSVQLEDEIPIISDYSNKYKEEIENANAKTSNTQQFYDSPQFPNTFLGDQMNAYNLVKINDGGIIIAGNIGDDKNDNIIMAKIDPITGDLIWAKSIGYANSDYSTNKDDKKYKYDTEDEYLYDEDDLDNNNEDVNIRDDL